MAIFECLVHACSKGFNVHSLYRCFKAIGAADVVKLRSRAQRFANCKTFLHGMIVGSVRFFSRGAGQFKGAILHKQTHTHITTNISLFDRLFPEINGPSRV